MVTQKWIDQSLFEMLPVLRDKGEKQRVEFIAKYPENKYELSREIATFVSSNPRTILIGVSETGTLKLVNSFAASVESGHGDLRQLSLSSTPNPTSSCNRDETVRD